jgi:acetyl-CoA carboxylase carboxyl transferase subunit alpha
MTAPDLLRLGIVDKIVEEPAGGAHQDHDQAARLVDAAISAALRDVREVGERGGGEALIQERYARFRRIGVFAS